jgi:hypothetical protein
MIPAHSVNQISDDDSRPQAVAWQAYPARPPRLNLNSIFIPTSHDEIRNHDSETAGRKSEIHPKPPVIEDIRNILSGAGFDLKRSPRIAGAELDFWAVGTDEKLMFGIACGGAGGIRAAEGGNSMWKSASGAFKSPVWTMTSVMQKLQGLFAEVLDPDLIVHATPFVFADGKIENRAEVQKIWDALGVLVFDDLAAFGEFAQKNRPRALLDAEEKGDYAAFSNFIDAAAETLAGQGDV